MDSKLASILPMWIGEWVRIGAHGTRPQSGLDRSCRESSYQMLLREYGYDYGWNDKDGTRRSQSLPINLGESQEFGHGHREGL